MGLVPLAQHPEGREGQAPLEGGAPPGPDPGPEPTPRLPEALCRCSGERGRQTGVRQGRGRGARGGGDGGERTRAKEGFVASGRPEVGSLKPLGQKPELPCRCSGGQGRWKAKWWKVEDGRRPRLPCCHRPIRALGDGVAPHRPTPDSTNRLNNSMTMRRTERQARAHTHDCTHALHTQHTALSAQQKQEQHCLQARRRT